MVLTDMVSRMYLIQARHMTGDAKDKRVNEGLSGPGASQL